MSHVTIEGLGKRFEGKPPSIAIDDLHLEIPRGEFLVLLGPSGCGKTTTLRCLAGLETPDLGSIGFGDQTVFDSSRRVNLPPDKRNIGMVFQSYALWPHLTVRRNIAYPLKARRIRHGLSEGWVEETARLVDCATLLDRYPAQLSGGQQQRVALARGLVARPDLVLFDEPLSNLDARLRDSVRAEIHELHQRLHFTAVFVTHDQSEALALGDRLAIMRSGRVEQLDTPEQVFEHPGSEYVAAFVGLADRVTLTPVDGDWRCLGQTVRFPVRITDDVPAEVHLRFRPDDLHLDPLDAPIDPDAVALRCTVADAEYGGRHMDVVVAVGDERLQARVPCGASGSWSRRLTAGTEAVAWFLPSAARSFGADERRLDLVLDPSAVAGR